MQRYYFLTTLLPPLVIGQPPELGSQELEFFLRLNLTKADRKDVESLRGLTDLDNIRLLLMKEPISSGGNYTEKELEECLLQQEKLPKYIFDFFETYTERRARLNHFAELYHHFFRDEIKKHTGFTRAYLTFEHEWRLVFSAIRSENLGRDFTKEFVGEDPNDPFIQELLDQRTSFEPPEQYKELKTMYNEHKNKPLELYQSLCEWRFHKIDEMSGWHTFFIDRILAYIVKLEICEKWLEMDKKKGLEIIETTVKGIA